MSKATPEEFKSFVCSLSADELISSKPMSDWYDDWRLNLAQCKTCDAYFTDADDLDDDGHCDDCSVDPEEAAENEYVERN